MLIYSEFQLPRQLHFVMVVIWVRREPHPCHCCHLQRFQQVVEGIRQQFRQKTMFEIRWLLPLYQNQQAHLHLGFQELIASFPKLIQVKL